MLHHSHQPGLIKHSSLRLACLTGCIVDGGQGFRLYAFRVSLDGVTRFRRKRLGVGQDIGY